jgi:hypothetical protein
LRAPIVCQSAISEGISWPSVIFQQHVRQRSGWLQMRIFETASEADAGTRTPDPIITSYERSARWAHG